MRRSYWLYGLLMGALLLLLQAVQFRTLFYNQRLELFGGVVAVIFMGVGIWLGVTLRQRKGKPEPQATPSASNPPKATITPESLGISPREADVLALLMEGHSNQEIADQLFVSLNTVKTHLANLYQKLEVQRRAQAIRKVQELGLVLSGDLGKSPVRVKE